MQELKRLPARFFESDAGRVPVREWLLALSPEDRKIIGNDIRTAEFGWPVGMPLCRSIKGHKGLWEIRSNLSGGLIARVFFCVHQGAMVLLHGFIKARWCFCMGSSRKHKRPRIGNWMLLQNG